MTDQQPHTPTTETVRLVFAEYGSVTKYQREQDTRAFDRWLATVEAAAEQRGAVKALRDVIATYWNESGDLKLYSIKSTLREELEHRADQIEDDDERN